MILKCLSLVVEWFCKDFASHLVGKCFPHSLELGPPLMMIFSYIAGIEKMRILVITLVALGLTNVLVTADKPEDYPPPPPVPAAKSVSSTTTTTTVKPVVKKIKPSEVPVKSRPRSLKPELGKKKKLAIKKSKKEVPVQAAQRRDSSYGAPSYAPPKRQVIIKPAGPSKQYAWVGHGRYAPLNIPNPFPDDLPKWIPMGNNIFEAGLLYPGKPGSAPASPKKPAPPPPAAPSYSAPVAQPSYSSPQASVDSYSAPEPAPVYNPKPTEAPKVVNLPVEIPAQPAYPSVPSYGQSTLLGQYEPVTAVPAYTTAPPAYTTTQPAYQYQQPTSQYQQPSSQYQQPSSPSKPFTAFGSQAQSSYAPTLPDIGPPGNYPTFNNLPGYSYNEPSYEAQASYESSKSAPVPNTYNAYDVPLKVEETYQQPDDQDVYFIFYEDNQEAPGSPGYVSEAAPPAPTNNQFKPPDNEDIR